MNKKFAKVLLAAGLTFLIPASVTFAADNDTNSDSEIKNSEKIHFPISQKNFEPPEFLVKGAVKDITQKILPISVEARFFAPHMDMGVKSDKFQYNGGEVTLKDTLGFGNDNAPEIIFRYKRFTADYFMVHGASDKNFIGDFVTFGGKNFSGNVNSQSDLHYLKLQVTNPMVQFLGAGIDWSYGLTGIYWKGTAKGNEFATGYPISESKSFGAPVPTLGIGAHASLLDTLLFRVHLSGMTLGGHGHLYDFEAGLRYNPIDLLSISLGYRKIHAQITNSGDKGTLDLDGPYAGLRFDF